MRNKRSYYFDNAATSWPKPEVVYCAVDKALRHGGNPGRGGYKRALAAEELIFSARQKVASFFGIEDSSQLVFTLNATDALNMAIKGVLKEGDHVLITPFEHNSVLRPLNSLERDGLISVTEMPCSLDGELDLRALPPLFQENTKMVIVTHASNVTGQILPVTAIATLAREKGALLLLDVAQTAGVYPVNVQDLKPDLMVFAGHKGLLGPQGTAGLYLKKNVKIKPWREGGTGSRSEEEIQPQFMPDFLEAGTLNVPGIAGLEAGINFIQEEGLNHIRSHEMTLAGKLRSGLRVLPGVRVYGPENPQDGVAVVSFEIVGVDSGSIGFILEDIYGIISRTGLHCAPRGHKGIGTFPRGTVRLSPGYFTAEEEVDYLLKAVAEIVEETVK